VLGLTRAGQDIDREVAAALHLSALGANLSRVATLDDRAALEELRRLAGVGPLRHLSLVVRDDRGQTVLAPEPAPAPPWPVSWLVALHRDWADKTAPRVVTWPLARPAGPAWQITLEASTDSERVEAMENLAGALLVVALGAAALLAAMAINVRLAFRPMRSLLRAIDRLRGGDASALAALPAMPTRELQSIGDALRALGDALADAEEQRRALSHKVMTLQEDERARLARELHDEFGQRLTALRADAAWIRRRVAADEQAARVVDGIARHTECLQADVRDLLVHLQPTGAGSDAMPGAQAVDLLSGLVAGWNASPGVQARFELDVGEALVQTSWQRELALTVYRISQEALTNAARHSRARHVRLGLAWRTDSSTLEWTVEDDGVGVADWQLATQRGNGLGGLRERVWALGADLQAGPASAGSTPGLRLKATFGWPAFAPDEEPRAALAA
jgi:two-component system sensor histidine kinase UhpB